MYRDGSELGMERGPQDAEVSKEEEEKEIQATEVTLCVT